MVHGIGGVDQARVLAELLDTAMADDWNEDSPAMVLLWQGSTDPADLRVAVRRLQGSVEDELALLDDDRGYLAVAHSTVTRHPPADLLPPAPGHPVRLTLAVDYRSQSGVVRHPDGATEWLGATVDVPIARILRSYLRLDPAA